MVNQLIDMEWRFGGNYIDPFLAICVAVLGLERGLRKAWVGETGTTFLVLVHPNMAAQNSLLN